MNHYLREETEKNTVHKTDPMNLLADRTKSIVKLIIFVLSSMLKAVLPNSYVCVNGLCLFNGLMVYVD